MRFTEEKIGVLFFVSFLEKKVMIIADRGAKMAVPEEEWNTIQEHFDSIFNEGIVSDNILKSLANCKDIFNSYIPPIENDINELPDNLEVSF